MRFLLWKKSNRVLRKNPTRLSLFWPKKVGKVLEQVKVAERVGEHMKKAVDVGEAGHTSLHAKLVVEAF